MIWWSGGLVSCRADVLVDWGGRVYWVWRVGRVSVCVCARAVYVLVYMWVVGW